MALHIKKIKPLNNYLVVTGEKYQKDIKENGIIVSNKGDLKLYQKVLAVGDVVRGIEVGNTVMINPMRYAAMKYKPNELKGDMYTNEIIGWKLPWVTLDDEDGISQECLLLVDSDIKFVCEVEETSEDIIVPKKPSIITS